MKKIFLILTLSAFCGQIALAQKAKKSKKVQVAEKVVVETNENRAESATPAKVLKEYGRTIVLPTEMGAKLSDAFMGYYVIPESDQVFKLIAVDKDPSVAEAPLLDGSVLKTNSEFRTYPGKEDKPSVSLQVIGDAKVQIFSYKIMYQGRPALVQYALVNIRGANKVVEFLTFEGSVSDTSMEYVREFLFNDAVN
jgi:hypothetical protein